MGKVSRRQAGGSKNERIFSSLAQYKRGKNVVYDKKDTFFGFQRIPLWTWNTIFASMRQRCNSLDHLLPARAISPLHFLLNSNSQADKQDSSVIRRRAINV